MGLTSKAISWSLAVCLLTMASGCGGKSGTGLPTGTVSGKVTRKGQAVTGVTVNFFPVSKGRGGSAELSAEGTYSLLSSKGTAIDAAEYKVCLGRKVETAAKDPQALMSKPIDPNAKIDDSLAIPAKWFDAEKTGWKFTVEAGKPNEINIDIPE